MEKLIHIVKEELKNVEQQGLNPSNLETTYKLVDIVKDLYEIKEKEKEQEEGSRLKRKQREKIGQDTLRVVNASTWLAPGYSANSELPSHQ